ncbi:MAG: sulfite exporter TauE/SafE family protein [Steroidobacter sp.]
MSTTVDTISLSAAFIAGLAGSAHCFAMCGSLAGALGMQARAIGANAGGAFGNALSYHVGRLSGYALAGAICGLLGATLQALLDLARVGAWLRIASGVLLLLIALRMLSPWNPLHGLETFGAKFWRHLQPLVRRTGALSGRSRSMALGFLWGWLPCGLVYSMLLFAALGGNAIQGGATLFAFGLGTLPAMLTSTVLASYVQRLLRNRWPRFASGILLLLLGAWMIWISLPISEHAHHH